jgi:hypothetical protein
LWQRTLGLFLDPLSNLVWNEAATAFPRERNVLEEIGLREIIDAPVSYSLKPEEKSRSSRRELRLFKQI